MAKAKRVALAIPESIDEVLTKLSELTGQPKTAIITELLTDAEPVFREVIKAMEQAKEGQMKAAVDTCFGFLSDVSVQLNQSHLDLGELKGKHGA